MTAVATARTRHVRLAWWPCVGSLVMMAAGLLLLVLSRHARFPLDTQNWHQQALTILGFLGAPILGGLIAARRPANPYRLVWQAIGLGAGVDALARGYATYGLLGRPGGLPAATAAAWATNVTWLLPIALFPLVLLLFPDGHPPTRRWRPLVWLVLALAVALPLEGAVAPGPLQVFRYLDNPIGVSGGLAGWVVDAFGQIGFFPLFVATIPAAAVALALRFRRATGRERQQLKWFAAAGLVLAAVPVADAVTLFGFESNRLIELLTDWLLYVAIGIAILRHRLYDIDRLLNRTLVYGLLTALLGGCYAGVVLALGQVFGRSSPLAVAIATLMVAAAFQPARRRVQAAVDRRFNRRRYDAARTIRAFSTRLRQQLELEAVTTELLAVAEKVMEPTTVWLAVAAPTGRIPTRRRGPSRHHLEHMIVAEEDDPVELCLAGALPGLPSPHVQEEATETSESTEMIGSTRIGSMPDPSFYRCGPHGAFTAFRRRSGPPGGRGRAASLSCGAAAGACARGGR
jgi:hypothetical protein